MANRSIKALALLVLLASSSALAQPPQVVHQYPPPGGPQCLTGVNTQTTSYTLALSDANNCVASNSASAVTITVPLNATVAFPVGTVVSVQNVNTGVVTVAGAGGVTVNNPSGVTSPTLGYQFDTLSLRKTATDTWAVTGATLGDPVTKQLFTNNLSSNRLVADITTLNPSSQELDLGAGGRVVGSPTGTAQCPLPQGNPLTTTYYSTLLTLGAMGDLTFCTGWGSPFFFFNMKDNTFNANGGFLFSDSAGNGPTFLFGTAATTACTLAGLTYTQPGGCTQIAADGNSPGRALVLEDATGGPSFVTKENLVDINVGDTTAVHVLHATSTGTSQGTLLLGDTNASSITYVRSATPTVVSGFGTGPTIGTGSVPGSIVLTVGTGGTASTGVVGLVTATNAWACTATDTTTAGTNETKQTGAPAASSATFTNFNTTTGAAQAWTAGDVLVMQCSPH